MVGLIALLEREETANLAACILMIRLNWGARLAWVIRSTKPGYTRSNTEGERERESESESERE
jgi:hypothetical protein